MRPANVPTPCDKCPKKSPEQAKELTLDRRNVRALSHYAEVRAVGMSEAEREDLIVRRNFAILEPVMRHYERTQQARLTALEISKIMPPR